MYQLKTQLNDQDVKKFLEKIEDGQKKADCFEILEIMKDITKEEPKMWGTAIIGFGTYHYKYASGTEGDWFRVGFSPRKQNITLYIIPGYQNYQNYLDKLGKHKIGKSCLYIKKLADIDLKILKQLISESIKAMNEKYPV